MKPYGRDRNLKGGKPWKRNLKLPKGYRNWWEDIIEPSSRSRMKREWIKESNKEITE